MPQCRWRICEKFLRRPWCPEVFKPPLTCALVREHPRMFALTLLVAQSTLARSSFVRNEGHVRYNRREKTGGQQSQVSLSAPKAAEPRIMPFAQRLTCTVDDACEATGLGRTKLYELIGAGRIITTTIGRRRLVVVHSLMALLDTNMSN
ncbi:helix-turn-helix domain-containing protein [Bradyrhizobium sp. WSM2793]|uniref:helix-turn-helix domain-containing protein n=1 Tax=Bradyrhizobium sp. WSM2793 TaxID=1038866 RepID=UPI0035295E5C